MGRDLDDWVFLKDEVTGSCYYANIRTRETRWDPPWSDAGDGTSNEAEAAVKLANGWFKYVDENSVPYYYNKVTQETQWTMPTDAVAHGAAAVDSRTRCASSTMYAQQSAALHSSGLDDDGASSDEDAMPPPLPSLTHHMASDDVDAPEEDVYVRNVSYVGGVLPPSKGTAERQSTVEEAIGREGSSGSLVGEASELEVKAQKRAARRLKILEEVVSSEAKYVQALQTLEKVYMIPMRMVADQPKGAIFQHADLDAVFINMDVIVKVNSEFLEELEAEAGKFPDVNYGQIIARAAKKFKGCYTRYVNNYDAAELHLNKLKKHDKEKFRYLDVQKSHPDAGGLDVRSFLIQPVQRVPRYRMLLEDLLAHTDEGHPDEAPLNEALEKVREVAMHINEEKRHLEEVDKLRKLGERFATSSNMEKELVRYDRRFLKEGELAKVRLTHRQRRQVFLFNDLLIYAVGSKNGLVVKGKISLQLGARVERLPNTEHLQNAFAVIDKVGKGYTWVGDTEEHAKEWFDAVQASIELNRPKRESRAGGNLLGDVSTKTPSQRLDALKEGMTLMKYNQRDGKSGARFVRLSADCSKICWGDLKGKDTKSDMKLGDAVALLHGAKSSAFFKQQGAKKDQDWLCFSVVFKGRTLDFAATNAEALFDWYLSLAQLLPRSTEPLLDEASLRSRMESML